jgi:hypothetical protein
VKRHPTWGGLLDKKSKRKMESSALDVLAFKLWSYYKLSRMGRAYSWNMDEKNALVATKVKTDTL